MTECRLSCNVITTARCDVEFMIFYSINTMNVKGFFLAN